MKYILNKNRLKNFLKRLSKDYDVYLVTEEKVKKLEDLKELNGFNNSKIPPKSLLLPQMEELLRYEGDKTIEPEDFKKTIIFGIRPCDTHSFKLLDYNFIQQKPVDEYYKKRRENLITFTLGCNNPDETCFCETFGLSPFYKDSSDVFVWDLKDRYMLEGITEKGKRLLKGLERAKDKDLKEAEEIEKKATAKKLNIKGIDEKLKNMIDSDYWEKLQRKCLGCGACTFLCPTCYCFDIQDLPREGWGKRIRVWDSCMFKTYTLETSGHNPRPTLVERWRQRFMHKFNYYPELFKEFGCVGCGRCVRECPVNLDIRQAIREVMEL